MRILLDTNFIIDSFRYKVDMAEAFDLLPGARLATIPQVVSELKMMASKKSTHSRYAKVAVSLIDKVEIVEAPEGKADDVLSDMADEENIVATNDGILRNRIKGKGVKTIYLRARKHLAVS